MRTRAPRTRRGQAIVEMSLAMLVFVTVLLFGMHFAEVTVTEMKVTEAAQAAVWDSTAGTMHTLPVLLPFTGNYGLAAGRVAFALGETQGRYADFDGRTLVGASGHMKQIMSAARPGSMNIVCNTGAGLNQSASGGIGPGLLFSFLHEKLVYSSDNGGMRCQADAWTDPMGVMRISRFMEGAGGFFNKGTGAGTASQTKSSAITSGYHACAVNRPAGLNGGCTGSFSMLIDDWGLASGSEEKGLCPVLPWGIPCLGMNINFWTSSMVMYELNSLLFGTQNDADLDMVKLVGNPPAWTWWPVPYLPGRPTSFYMAYMGEETMFIMPTIWSGDFSNMFWNTTPATIYWPTYTVAYVLASGCYLGQPCNTSSITNP